MSKEDHQMRIRISSDLKDKIEAVSYENRRSMNAEIVARLEASFDDDRRAREKQEFFESMDRWQTEWRESMRKQAMEIELLKAEMEGIKLRRAVIESAIEAATMTRHMEDL